MDHDALPPFEPRQARQGGFQFSLLGLFLLMTAAAVMLGGSVALAAALGVDPAGALLQAVGRQITGLPSLALWLVALAMLLNGPTRHSRAAKYGLCGFGGLLLLSMLNMGLQVLLFAAMNNNAGWSMSTITWIFPIYSFMYSLLSATCHGFLLAAILTGRSGDAAGVDRAQELLVQPKNAEG
jgi:hypothetical protein